MFADCQAQCGDVVLRTAAKAKTTTPQWAQNFTFGVKKPLGDAVRFKVLGLNERGRDVLLGSAALQIETLAPDTQVEGSRERGRKKKSVGVLMDAVLFVAVDNAQADAVGRRRQSAWTINTAFIVIALF